MAAHPADEKAAVTADLGEAIRNETCRRKGLV